MLREKDIFEKHLGIKKNPNEEELLLFARAQKYTRKLAWIPGIEMIAIVNSLSMYATHRDSDIDLFIITKPHAIWFVRFFVTLTLWMHGVWRHGKDIRHNFCLSFFITTNAMNLEKIALENDIYLFYWVYFLKPILSRNNTYEKWKVANKWVETNAEQEKENLQFLIEEKKGVSLFPKKGGTIFIRVINDFLGFFLRRKAQKRYKKLGKPVGVIISEDMLKFHDQDRRTQIRDAIFAKNFDK